MNVLNGHIQTVTSAKFISSDNYIVSCSNDSTVCLWDCKNQSKLNIMFEDQLFILEFVILLIGLIENLYLQGSLTSISESYNSR